GNDIADGSGRYRAAEGSRQVLCLFLGCLHQRRRGGTCARWLDLPALALVADLSMEVPILPDRRGAVVVRTGPAAAFRTAPSPRYHWCGACHGVELRFYAGAHSRRRAFRLAVGAGAGAHRLRGAAWCRFRAAAALGSRAAYSDRRIGRSDCPACHADSLLRLGLDHRAEHFSPDVSAERTRLVAYRRGLEPDHPDGHAEHQRGIDQPAHRSRQALQGAADTVPFLRDWGGARAGLFGVVHDGAQVRDHPALDRYWIRANSAADPDCATEHSRGPPSWR